MKSLEAWKQSVLGQRIDLDNQSYDCVDVSKHWVEYLTGVKWTTSAGWGNAKDIYSFWSNTYLDKLPAGSAPKLGDICVMDGTVGGGYGHTGVVIGISGNNITIAQQNTFTQQAVYTGVWNAYGSYIKYMRPKTAFTVGLVPDLAPDERIPAYAAKYRTAAKADAPLMKTDTIPDGLLTAGETYKFKGYVVGENVDGNDKWLVGFYSGGYVWSGAMTDIGLHDLPNITPASLQPNERQVGADVMNVRREPTLMPDNVIAQLQPGEVKAIEHWKAGSPVEGNNVWFKISGSGYVHSSGFTNTSTANIPEVKDPVTVPPVTPTPPQYADLTNKVIDISSHNEVVDFALAKSSVRGVVAKAGHTGVSYGGVQPQNEDPTFKKYKREFGEKLVGAYWYGYPSLNAETEAHAFLTSVGDVPDNFTYWLDIEEPDGVNDQAKVNEWCQLFLETVEMNIGRKAGIYCNRNWYDKILTADTKAQRPIWLAHYGIAEMSNPVERQVAHQYTSDGRVPGFATDDRVDLNAVTEGFFIKLAPPTPDPVPTDPVTPTPDPEDPVIVQPTPEPGVPDVITRIKTVAVNATVTFVQAFLATWAATGFNLDKVVLAGAVGGALSLVWNTILKPFAISQGWLKQ